MLVDQKDFVLSHLRRDGTISRNYCLRNNLTRLGALINKLKNEGFDIKGEYDNNDYVYKLYTKVQVKGEINNGYVINDKINQLIKETPPSWDNLERLKDLKQALESKNNVLKRSVIERYT